MSLRQWFLVGLSPWVFAACGGAAVPPAEGRPDWCARFEAAMATLEEPPPGVLALKPGITPPQNISLGEPIRLLPTFNCNQRTGQCGKAWKEPPQGPVQARCVITTEGATTSCRILEAPRGAEASIVKSLETRRYRPAELNGTPVAVYYPFNFQLTAPDEMPPDPIYDASGNVWFDGRVMTPPRLLSGLDPVYTAEALRARVQGSMIILCTLTSRGYVEKCRVIRPLPFMEAAGLTAVSSRHYTPVLKEGHPVDVLYTFNIKLVMPPRYNYAAACR